MYSKQQIPDLDATVLLTLRSSLQISHASTLYSLLPQSLPCTANITELLEGKHPDELIEQLVISTEGKTDCKQFNSADWGSYERVLRPEIQHYISKDRARH